MKQTFEDPGFDRAVSSLRFFCGSSAFACTSPLVSLASQDFMSRVDSCRRSFMWSLCITLLSFQWKLKGANQPGFNRFGGIVNVLNPVIFTFSCAEIVIRIARAYHFLHFRYALLATAQDPQWGSPLTCGRWEVKERGGLLSPSYRYSLVMIVSILLHVHEKCTLPAYPVNAIGFHAKNGNRSRP